MYTKTTLNNVSFHCNIGRMVKSEFDDLEECFLKFNGKLKMA